MYGIDGRAELTEEVLGHLEGYRGSAPVRIGNGAADQLQLDIYGELIDSVYLFDKYGSPIHHDAWMDLTRVVEWVCENWDQADEGVWEVRGGRQDFTYSRLMCWVALERAIRVAIARGLPRRALALAAAARRDLPPDHDQGLAREPAGIRPALRHGRSRRRRAPDAAGEVHRADRQALALDDGRDRRRARPRQPRLSLRRRVHRRRARGRGGHLLDLHVLVRRGPGAWPASSRRPGSHSRRC